MSGAKKQPPQTEKLCPHCHKIKPASEYYLEPTGRLRSWCKDCKKEGVKNKLIKSTEELQMKEAQFNAIYNNMSSEHKKVYESVPIDTYWSASRIGGELFRRGIKQDAPSIKGILNYLVKTGVVLETSQGMFSRESVTKPSVLHELINPPKKEAQMVKKETQSPFDSLREVAIEFMDLAKAINTLATKMDTRLADVEKHISLNDKDNEKLKQLQVLLKSLA